MEFARFKGLLLCLVSLLISWSYSTVFCCKTKLLGRHKSNLFSIYITSCDLGYRVVGLVLELFRRWCVLSAGLLGSVCSSSISGLSTLPYCTPICRKSLSISAACTDDLRCTRSPQRQVVAGTVAKKKWVGTSWCVAKGVDPSTRKWRHGTRTGG